MNALWQSLKGIPWATMGRPESTDELLQKLKGQRAAAATLKEAPLFSLIVPLMEEIDLEHFSQFLSSLRAQSYPYWEAVFVTRGSLSPLKILAFHDEYEGSSHFRWIEMSTESSLCDLKNEGVARANGDYWAVVEADAVLHPSAIFLFATETMSRPGADVIYCNEVELGLENSGAVSFISKPEFSWVDAIHFPMFNRLVVVKKTAFSERFDAVFPEYHESDHLFRLIEQEKVFRLLPYYLYYHRAATQSPVMSEWQRVVETHLRRKGFPATLEIFREQERDLLKVTPILSRAADRLVSVVVCFRNKVELTQRAVEHLARQNQNVKLEFILMNNESDENEVKKLGEGLKRLGVTFKIIDYPYPFNFARMNNIAVREHARGEFVLLLNNDVFWHGEKTLDAMVAWAAIPSVGTVGIRLVYPDGRLQHAGLIARFGGEARLARLSNNQKEDRFTSETHAVFVNTFAASLFRKQLFEKVGGLRELEFANGFGDVVFNFECLKLGLKNLYLGHVVAEHMESASRGQQYEYWEEVGLEREFPEILAKMLRQDIGENRNPGHDIAIGKTIREAISQELTSKAPGLKRGLKRAFDLFS